MKRSIVLLAATLTPMFAIAQAAQQPRPISTVLLNTLDARKAKVGDTVKVRTYSGFSTSAGQRVPPGSIITGHITDVSKLVKGVTESRLAVVFDQAQLSGDQTVAIHMGIAGLAAAPPITGLENPPDLISSNESTFAGARSTGTTVNSSGQRSTGNTTGGTDGTRVTRTTVGRTDLANAARNDSPVSGDHVGGTASVGTTIPGIALQPSPTTQSTLVSTSNNIFLRNGTPFVLLPIANQQ